MLVEVTYGITKELQKRLLVETGEREGDTRTESVDLDSKELRQSWVTLFGLNLSGAITHRSYSDTIEAKYDLGTFRFELPPACAEILTNDEIKTAILVGAATFRQELAEAKRKATETDTEYKANLEMARPLIERIERTSDLEALQAIRIPSGIADFKARSQLWPLDEKRSRAISNAYDAQKDAQREAEKAQREADKTAWIKAHGSDRLQRAFADQYEVGRIYTLERAAHEYPEWTIDFFGFSEWRDRKNPSLAELDAADDTAAQTGQSVSIVWLTQPAAIDREEFDISSYDFEQHAALVIRDYLGKYDLVKNL